MKLLFSILLLVLTTSFAHADDLQGTMSSQFSKRSAAVNKQKNEARMMRDLKAQVAKVYGAKVARDLTTFVKTNGSNGRVCNDQRFITHVIGENYACEVFHYAVVCDYKDFLSQLQLRSCIPIN